MDLKDVFLIKEEASTMRLSEDSADSQLDSILLTYQNDSSIEGEVAEGILPKHFKLLLGEADDEEDMSVGDEEQQATSPAKPREQKINVDQYAQRVANLIDNYQNLLNMKPVIINRAKNILAKGYLPEIVDEFLEKLEIEFGHSLEEYLSGEEEDKFGRPPAGGSAGPIGA